MTQILGNLFIDGEGAIEDENSTYSITNNGTSLDTVNYKKGSSSVKINGASNYLDINSPADLYLDTTSDWTVDYWAYHELGSTDVHHIHALNNVGGKVGFGFRQLTDTFYLAWGNGNVYSPGVSLSMDYESWNHYAFVHSAGSIKMYYNGTLIDTISSLSGSTQGITTLTIGRGCNFSGGVWSGGWNYLNGNVDNVRIAKGVALWSTNFNVDDDDAMFYAAAESPEENPYVRPGTITGLYHIENKLRGKAKEGFIRPTIREMFKSERDYVEVLSIPIMQPTYFNYVSGMTLSESNLRATSNGTWKYADLKGFKESGKWFIEFENLSGDGWAGPVNPDYNTGYGYQREQSIHVVNNYTTLGCIYSNNSYVGPVGAVNWTVGSYLGIAYDMATGEIKAYINGDLKATYIVPETYRPQKMTFSYCAMNTQYARVTPTAISVHYPIPSGYIYFG